MWLGDERTSRLRTPRSSGTCRSFGSAREALAYELGGAESKGIVRPHGQNPFTAPNINERTRRLVYAETSIHSVVRTTSTRDALS